MASGRKGLQGRLVWTAIASALLMTSEGASAATPTIPGLDSADAPVDPAADTAATHWTTEAVRQLLRVVRSADAQGLNPRDYNLDGLRAAVETGPNPTLDVTADAAALSLAHDYLFGRVSDKQSMGWLIERSPYEASQLPAALQAAVAAGKLDQFYASLLPTDDRYQALRSALADASDPDVRDRLRANMERERWMPRTADQNYIYVNIPSYRLQLIDNGQVTSTYTVVVGAKDTPTPAMITPTSSLVVNPWWNVPQSIVRKSNMRPGRPGFQFTKLDGGNWTVRQPPGPRNALGRIKFNLVNDQAIYLHDTPAKAAFVRDDRALSHGCIRVKNINRLASELMQDGGDEGALDTALAGTQTATLRLPQTWPVHIVYFTEDLSPAGGLVSYPDTYGYDQKIVAALDGPKLEVASRD